MKMVAVAALAEEIGRAALPSPLIATLFATVRAARGEDRRGDDVARAHRRRRRRATLGDHQRATARGSPDATSMRVETTGDGAVLDGTAPFVQDARKAAFFVVAARERRRASGSTPSPPTRPA